MLEPDKQFVFYRKNLLNDGQNRATFFMNSSSFSSPNLVNSEPIEQNLQRNMEKYDFD